MTEFATWIVAAAATASFASGWFMHRWQCSKKRECPLYNEYALAKWKRGLTTQGRRNGLRCDVCGKPKPPEGTAA